MNKMRCLLNQYSESNSSCYIFILGDADSIVHSARDHDTPQIHHESYEMDDQELVLQFFSINTAFVIFRPHKWGGKS